ncbi:MULTISPECIES: transporter substrate-binding domain-containing protein [Cytobacillus]|uniref:Amino acid ABC transporter substrate-binding protein n=1 Tax=Cytobacillus kochii TaxID=859143 RepID=A0A248TJ00_9BACI|nr:transporter substrate-binding domain-containing protein [Cytobacillus kochii]ASV68184.1 amino acid ABC transporter substrate-binding protein [Cytobacillus kochii]MDQ0185768.1 L-cystine transport system substrate-binding protein [Cytobacillus kochii]MED1604939.1 transporter substrate-binding domain-containing protein [Cytobacillus kochii]
MKGLKITFLLIISVLFIAGCSSSSNGTTEDGKKVITVAISDEVNPPFLYADDNNEPIGYDMDYLKEVEKKLEDYHFEYVWGEEEANLVGVDTGKYDFAINWFFKNPEREEKFLYPEQEFGYSLTSLVTQPNRDDIKTLEDMVGKKLAPMSPSGGLRTILNSYNKNNPDEQIDIESIEFPSNADNLERVNDGKDDAMFINVTTFNAVQKELDLNLKVAGIVSKEPVYTVFNKEHTELAKEFDDVTKELIEDGTLPDLAEKWFEVNFFENLDYINEENYKFNP